MPYTVRISTGKGKNRTVSQSIPLSNKERVRRWIRRNPVGNANTVLTIKNLRTDKTETMRKIKGYLYGWRFK